MANEQLLNTVPSEKAFWINNGPVVASLTELASAVKTLSGEQFTHHVNKEKNDFAVWVHEVVGDSTLASKLQKTRSQRSASKLLDNRVNHLLNHE